MQKVPITQKHLKDEKSDLLYEPFRQVGFISPTKSRIIIKQAFIPKQLQKLEVASNQYVKINPNRYVIIGQKVKTYPAIKQKIAVKLIDNAPQNQQIVYKYGKYQNAVQTISSQYNQQYAKRKYKNCKIQKVPQNRINFTKQKTKIVNVKKLDQKYNLMSVLDGPLNYLANKLTFTCGDCSNQIVATNMHQLIVQFDQDQNKYIQKNRVIRK